MSKIRPSAQPPTLLYVSRMMFCTVNTSSPAKIPVGPSNAAKKSEVKSIKSASAKTPHNNIEGESNAEGRLDSEGEGVGFPGVMLGRSEGSSVGEAEFDGESLGITSGLAEGLGDSEGLEVGFPGVMLGISDETREGNEVPFTFTAAMLMVGVRVLSERGVSVLFEDGFSMGLVGMASFGVSEGLDGIGGNEVSSPVFLKLKDWKSGIKPASRNRKNSNSSSFKKSFTLILYLDCRRRPPSKYTRVDNLSTSSFMLCTPEAEG